MNYLLSIVIKLKQVRSMCPIVCKNVCLKLSPPVPDPSIHPPGTLCTQLSQMNEMAGKLFYKIFNPDRDSTPTAVCLCVCLYVRNGFLKQ